MTSNGMPINKIRVNDIIKFILAVFCILWWLLRKVENIWETEQDAFFKDYLNQEEINQEEILTENQHQSAWDETLLCKPQDPLCNKISTLDIETSQANRYINNTHDITYTINDNLMSKKELIDTLKEILLKYWISERRWYATRNRIIINTAIIEDDEEFSNLVTHELGHIVDLWVVQWSKQTKDKLFTEFGRIVFESNDPSLYFYKLSRNSEDIRRRESTKKDFCSWYGMTNPFEDFSECFNLYINNQSFFKIIAKENKTLEKKYNFIATLLKGMYREKNIQSLALLKGNNSRRPWDTTKL